MRHFVCDVQELAGTRQKLIEIGGKEIGVYYVDGDVYAWLGVCPHRGAPMCRGLVSGTHLPSRVYEYEYGMENQILRCPFHGWEFNLKTGRLLLDDEVKLRGYETVVEDGRVYLLA